MLLTALTPTNQQRSVVDTFGGYNHNLKISDNEFYDMVGMTTDNYPVLSTSNELEQITDLFSNTTYGVIYKDDIWAVEGGRISCNGEKYDYFDLDTSVLDHQIVSMGAYIIIFPEKVYLNTKDHSDRGYLEAEMISEEDAESGWWSVGWFRFVDGRNEIFEPTVSPTTPDNKDRYWLDTSEEVQVIKKWSEETSMWVVVDARVKFNIIRGNDAWKYSEKFQKGDSIILETENPHPATAHLFNTPLIIDEVVDDDGYGDFEGGIYFKGYIKDTDGDSYLDGTERSGETGTEKVKVKRITPVMDYVIESNNRLWGCRYGEDVNGKFVNEIYASKLGDFKNWYSFAGVSTDSYAVSVGTDGKFTGAISYNGYPIFFKEHCMHKLYGQYPANYQIQNMNCKGVRDGSYKSLAIVDGNLLYQTTRGIAIYDGSMPVEISKSLGNVARGNGIATEYRKKYYICMEQTELPASVVDRYEVFSYDLDSEVWMKENVANRPIYSMFSAIDGDNEFLYILAHNFTLRYNAAVQEYDENSSFFGSDAWMIETGRLGASLPERKYITRLMLKMALVKDGIANIYIQYNSDGKWRHIKTIKPVSSMKAISVPIRPRRCDSFKIKIEGKKHAEIYSITKIIEEGSDR